MVVKAEKSLRLEWWDSAELAENPKNWRRHPPAQAAAMREILAEVGWAGAALYNQPTGHLIDGHLRKKVVKKGEKVRVLVGSWSDEQEAKIQLTLDPLGAMAEADVDRLEALLETVHTDNRAISELLARIGDQYLPPQSLAEVVDPAPQIERTAELLRKWDTERRQLWRIGPHRLVCGDCTKRGDVARLWRENRSSIRMIWTDPPYGVNYAAKNAYLNRSDRGNRIQTPIENDDLTAGQTSMLFKRALAIAKQFAEPGAACYATVPGGPLLAHFIHAFQASGFEYKHLLIWMKQQFVIGMADYQHRFEPILYGWLPNGAHYFVDDRTQDDVFEIDKPRVSDLHSTMKPVELCARMIANSSRPRELVYDPFAGSGSTLLAAHQLGRIGFGIEIDPAHVAVTLERMTLLGLQPELVK